MDRGRSEPAPRRRGRGGQARPVRAGGRRPGGRAPRLRLRLRGRPARRRGPRGDPEQRAAAGRGPARRRQRRLLGSRGRAPRPRSHDRERRSRPHVWLRPRRLGREDPHGLLLAVRDGAAHRAEGSLRRRVRQRSGRRPARDRHPRRRAAQPQPPARGLRGLPVRRAARLVPGRGDRQDAREQQHHRSSGRRPGTPARGGARRLQVVRGRAARRIARILRRGECGRLVPAPRRLGLDDGQGRADPLPAGSRDDRARGRRPRRGLPPACRALRRARLPARGRGRRSGAEGGARTAVRGADRPRGSSPASRSWTSSPPHPATVRRSAG